MADSATARPTYKHTPGGPDAKVYPHVGEYTFQEFAGPVIEFGGYRDATLIDPYTGDRHWFADIQSKDEDVITVATVLRRVADRMDEQGIEI